MASSLNRMRILLGSVSKFKQCRNSIVSISTKKSETNSSIVENSGENISCDKEEIFNDCEESIKDNLKNTEMYNTEDNITEDDENSKARYTNDDLSTQESIDKNQTCVAATDGVKTNKTSFLKVKANESYDFKDNIEEELLEDKRFLLNGNERTSLDSFYSTTFKVSNKDSEMEHVAEEDSIEDTFYEMNEGVSKEVICEKELDSDLSEDSITHQGTSLKQEIDDHTLLYPSVPSYYPRKVVCDKIIRNYSNAALKEKKMEVPIYKGIPKNIIRGALGSLVDVAVDDPEISEKCKKHINDMTEDGKITLKLTLEKPDSLDSLVKNVQINKIREENENLDIKYEVKSSITKEAQDSNQLNKKHYKFSLTTNEDSKDDSYDLDLLTQKSKNSASVKEHDFRNYLNKKKEIYAYNDNKQNEDLSKYFENDKNQNGYQGILVNVRLEKEPVKETALKMEVKERPPNELNLISTVLKKSKYNDEPKAPPEGNLDSLDEKQDTFENFKLNDAEEIKTLIDENSIKNKIKTFSDEPPTKIKEKLFKDKVKTDASVQTYEIGLVDKETNTDSTSSYKEIKNKNLSKQAYKEKWKSMVPGFNQKSKIPKRKASDSNENLVIKPNKRDTTKGKLCNDDEIKVNPGKKVEQLGSSDILIALSTPLKWKNLDRKTPKDIKHETVKENSGIVLSKLKDCVRSTEKEKSEYEKYKEMREKKIVEDRKKFGQQKTSSLSYVEEKRIDKAHVDNILRVSLVPKEEHIYFETRSKINENYQDLKSEVGKSLLSKPKRTHIRKASSDDEMDSKRSEEIKDEDKWSYENFIMNHKTRLNKVSKILSRGEIKDESSGEPHKPRLKRSDTSFEYANNKGNPYRSLYDLVSANKKDETQQGLSGSFIKYRRNTGPTHFTIKKIAENERRKNIYGLDSPSNSHRFVRKAEEVENRYLYSNAEKIGEKYSFELEDKEQLKKSLESYKKVTHQKETTEKETEEIDFVEDDHIDFESSYKSKYQNEQFDKDYFRSKYGSSNQFVGKKSPINVATQTRFSSINLFNNHDKPKNKKQTSRINQETPRSYSLSNFVRDTQEINKDRNYEKGNVRDSIKWLLRKGPQQETYGRMSNYTASYLPERYEI